MKKGFTLMELLTILVILALISLIVIPSVSNMVEKSRVKTIEESAYGYLRAVQGKSSLGELNSSRDAEDEGYTVDNLSDLGVAVKGIKPGECAVYLKEKNIDKATLCMNDYKVKYENGKVTSIVKEKIVRLNMIIHQEHINFI